MKKLPKQERSKQIVEAVLGGTTRILSQIPFDKVSTNKIAEIAGVSIGSLYDYFPNKSSIVSALIDQRVAEVVRRTKEILAKDPGSPLDEKAEEFVAFFSSEFIERKKLLREIFMLAPIQGRMELLYKSRAEVTQVLAHELLRRGVVIDEREALRQAFVLVQSIMGIVESYIIMSPDYFSNEEIVLKIRQVIKLHLTVS